MYCNCRAQPLSGLITAVWSQVILSAEKGVSVSSIFRCGVAAGSGGAAVHRAALCGAIGPRVTLRTDRLLQQK
jgi:hypothetical protein